MMLNLEDKGLTVRKPKYTKERTLKLSLPT